MGFFSWITQDTEISIANTYSSQPTSTVYMHDNNGNTWEENDYEGYGIFGSKDYYVLLAEMNGQTTREQGIDLDFKSKREDLLYPNLSHDPYWEWINKRPQDCPYQGFFY